MVYTVKTQTPEAVAVGSLFFFGGNLYLTDGVITAHAIFSPAFPEGCVVKSSTDEWTMIVFPMISEMLNLSVKNMKNATPFALNSGGRSPA